MEWVVSGTESDCGRDAGWVVSGTESDCGRDAGWVGLGDAELVGCCGRGQKGVGSGTERGNKSGTEGINWNKKAEQKWIRCNKVQ